MQKAPGNSTGNLTVQEYQKGPLTPIYCGNWDKSAVFFNKFVYEMFGNLFFFGR